MGFIYGGLFLAGRHHHIVFQVVLLEREMSHQKQRENTLPQLRVTDYFGRKPAKKTCHLQLNKDNNAN